MRSFELTPEKGEECGIAAVYGAENASQLLVSMLTDLQHRGQASAGIATSDGKVLYHRARTGLVSQAFPQNKLPGLPGDRGIGHTRWATSGGAHLRYAQPVFMEDAGILVSHNGHFPDTSALQEELAKNSISSEGLSDSQLVAEAVALHYRRKKNLPDALKKVYPWMTGAFSMLFMDKDTMVAVRDPKGIRPLSIGEIGEDGYVFASETAAFGPIGAVHARDVEPGEMVVIDRKGLCSERLVPGEQRLDIFEFIYFARPDSVLLGKSVYAVRKEFGKHLAREHPIDADIVIPVPQSGLPAAVGYAQESGIPIELALIKGRDRRTFIEPTAKMQKLGVKTKLSVAPGSVEGKRVVVVDDSIVRGNNSAQIVAMLREAGASEVHFLSSCPPIRYPDFYGLDLPDQMDLIAFGKTETEVAEAIGAESVRYLSYEGMIEATGLPENSFSTACFTGEYPLDIGCMKEKVIGLPSREAE